jgi:dipeptidyl aminopeptidase/acylaminoacyl peptidase
LITQTTRFNAALSGAGAVDHTSAWGTMDLPILFNHLFGGSPWDASHIYLTESPIYQLDKVRTPTLIVTG